MLVWDANETESISFEAFVEYLDGLGAAVLEGKLDETASMLSRLYNNREFLGEILLSQLADAERFEADNPYTPQVFMLHTGERYFIRAAIWTPKAGRKGEEIFFYEDPHDHNFSLLTLGYIGRGYRTSLFEYEHDAVEGYVGEVVAIRSLGSMQLSAGRTLFYRASRDIHVQYPPDDFSVSINVIVPHPERRQFSFSIEQQGASLTASIKENLVSLPLLLAARAASSLAVEGVVEQLRSVEGSAPCRHSQRLIRIAREELEGVADAVVGS